MALGRRLAPGATFSDGPMSWREDEERRRASTSGFRSFVAKYWGSTSWKHGDDDSPLSFSNLVANAFSKLSRWATTDSDDDYVFASAL